MIDHFVHECVSMLLRYRFAIAGALSLGSLSWFVGDGGIRGKITVAL